MDKEKLLNGEDFFEVQSASNFTDYDNKILLRLYQPLCGYAPISIFMTLISELEGEKTIITSLKNHHRLFATLSMTADKFVKNRKYLEALGLLKTFYLESDKETKYIYLLKSPVLPDRFFSHPILDSLLKSRLNDEEYERTKIYFAYKIKIKNNYEDISVKFQDVFKVNDHSGYSATGNYDLKGRNEAQINLTFDFEAFFLGLKDYQIPKNIIGAAELNKIAEYASLYNISAVEMRTLVAQSLEMIDNSKRINMERLAIIAKRFYETRGTVVIEKKTVSKNSAKIDNNGTLAKKLDLFTSISPAEFLKLSNNNMEPLACDLKLIADLKNETNLEDEVINVLLSFSLQKFDNKLITNYIKKVAGGFLRNNIHTAYDAMNSLLGNNFKKKETIVKDEKEKSNDNKPELLDEFAW